MMAAEIFNNAHRIAARYFGEGVVELLQPLSQRVGRAIIAGDAEEVRRIAEESHAVEGVPERLAGRLGRRPPPDQRNRSAVRCQAARAKCIADELDIARRSRGDVRRDA